MKDDTLSVDKCISPLTQSTAVSVYRGDKGSLHRKQENPRISCERDWYKTFVGLICNDDIEKGNNLIERFKELDSGSKACQELANGMLTTFYDLGARERLLRKVFGIGNSRYQRIAKGLPVSSGGGHNSNTLNDQMISSISYCVEELPTEPGFTCGHRRIMIYCTVDEIKTWATLYDFYVDFMKGDNYKDIRVMKYISFYNNVRARHPDLRLTRLIEDACDLCVELKLGENKLD